MTIAVLVVLVVLSLLGGLLLLWALKMFKIEGRTFGLLFLAVLVYSLVQWPINTAMTGKVSSWLVTAVDLILSWLILVPFLSYKYKTAIGKMTLAWLVWAVLYMILGVLWALVMAVIAGIAEGMASI